MRSYCVNRDQLRNASQEVRGVLEDIAREYVSKNGSYERFLPALARAGESLKVALFSPVDQDTSVEGLVSYLDLQPRGTPLTVFSDSTVHVPWGFVYGKDPRQLGPTRFELSDFDDFWLSLFKVRVRFNQTDLPPSRPISKDRIKTLLALHQSRFRAATEEYAETHPDLLAKIECLLKYQLGSTADWEDCRDKWESMTNDDSILYIFAHSDGKKLYLEESEKIDVAEKYKYELDTTGFSKVFKKRQTTVASNTLCFINGCRTADGDWGNGFLSITSGRGFHGFIGSEAEIANDWATRYAVEFLYALIEGGKSVDEAYEDTRKLVFPMSLWYSCYAHPSFRISAGVDQ
jgi:hypothetical protein